MADWYVLEGHKPKRAKDALAWERWQADHSPDRRVALDYVEGVMVSTVFLGLDHRMPGDRKPVLFETLVRGEGSPLDQECERYSTWEEAEAGHREMVQRMVEAMRAANEEPTNG